MRRGDIWIGSAHGDYTGKPRPQLIVQSDAVAGFDSVVVCPISSAAMDAGPLRLRMEPSGESGLRLASCILIDKVSAMPRRKLDSLIGRISSARMDEVSAALAGLLGIGG